MSNLHQEHHFETAICEYLAQHGWLYEQGDAADNYDRASALYLPDLLLWLETTQPTALQALSKTHGIALPKVLSERIRKNMNERGTLDVLRRGVEMLGLKQPLSLIQFKPALGLNPEIQKRYAANRLRVVRQGRDRRDRAGQDRPRQRNQVVQAEIGLAGHRGALAARHLA